MKLWPDQRSELEEIQESLLNLSGKEHFGTSKFGEFILNIMPKISNSDIQLLLELSLKFMEDLFMEYLLNVGAGTWDLQS